MRLEGDKAKRTAKMCVRVRGRGRTRDYSERRAVEEGGKHDLSPGFCERMLNRVPLGGGNGKRREELIRSG